MNSQQTSASLSIFLPVFQPFVQPSFQQVSQPVFQQNVQWPFHQISFESLHFSRRHQPVVDNCAKEAIPEWYKICLLKRGSWEEKSYIWFITKNHMFIKDKYKSLYTLLTCVFKVTLCIWDRVWKYCSKGYWIWSSQIWFYKQYCSIVEDVFRWRI